MEQILGIINEMSPYLLLGFLLAGLMHAFIPGQIYSRYLSKNNFSSVIYAALFGIPLPLCSCGVIPTAMSLRREGASKGAAVSFLIATPQTGVDSIIATFSLMGLPFAIIRPIAALVTALFGGEMVNLLDRQEEASSVSKTQDTAEPCTCGCGCGHHNHGSETIFHKLKEALEYAFVDMMADIGKWLLIGLIVAGLITVFVPASFFEIFADNSLLSMLLVLCLAVPMYLCATGSIPIAVALMLKGLTPGAGLVLLMAGPASNVASILVIRKVLGKKTQIIYLVSIIIGAVLFGLAIDHLMPREWFLSNLIAEDACCHEETSWFSWLCTGALFLMLFNALVLNKHHHSHNDNHNDNDNALLGNESNGEYNDNKNINNNMENTLTFHIEGMNCNHCRMSAEKALKSVAGVTDATVDLASKEARVTGNASMEDIKKAIDEIGFEVKI